MFGFSKILTDWVNWKNVTIQDEWNTWVEWQSHQSNQHYEKSDIFQYYLSKRPQFQPPKYSCGNNKYYIYCFGDFASLLVNPGTNADIIDYISLLLDVYDTCKGMSRYIIGDPVGISFLRDVISKHNLSPLKHFNFEKINYPYITIHAHTVAQYSLSTLIMRFLFNYIGHISTENNHYNISITDCKQVYENNFFGSPLSFLTGNSIPISLITDKTCNKSNLKTYDTRFNINSNITSECMTIPSCDKNSYCEDATQHNSYNKISSHDKKIYMRCKSCGRVTENLWGNFHSCLDCHLKRICSKCSANAIVISKDGLPKCEFHKNSQFNLNGRGNSI